MNDLTFVSATWAPTHWLSGKILYFSWINLSSSCPKQLSQGLIKLSQIQLYLIKRGVKNVSNIEIDFFWNKQFSFFFLKALLIFAHCWYFLPSIRNTVKWVLWCAQMEGGTSGYFEAYHLSLRWSSCSLIAFLCSDLWKISDRLSLWCPHALVFVSSHL